MTGVDQVDQSIRANPDEMPPELQHVLGMMVFRTAPIAHLFRDAGADIPRKAEAEQAYVLHWLIRLTLDHGRDWQERARADIDGAKARIAESVGAKQ